VAYEQTELPVKQGQQHDNGHRGRKQTEQATADEPYRIGIGIEGTRKNKAAEDKKGDDGTDTI
jgi:hypothetical protein